MAANKYNNTTSEFDGIKFKSRLEEACYKKLKESGLSFSYEPVTYNLIPSFEYEYPSYEKVQSKGKKTFKAGRPHVRGIKYTPDFVGDGWIIETKGFETAVSKIKWKMFKKLILDSGLHYTLFKPTNQAEIDKSIELIINILTTQKDGKIETKDAGADKGTRKGRKRRVKKRQSGSAQKK